MTSAETYQQVCDQVRQTALLQSTLALLEWDQHTKMPAQAASHRADQITALAAQIHRRRTDESLGNRLAELDGASESKEMPFFESNIKTLKRDFERHSKIPESLASALARAASEGQTAWLTAREQDDFTSFAPNLKNIVALKQEQAQAIGFQEHPYDALADEYEPGMTTKEIERVLGSLCQALVPLVAKIKDNHSPPDTECLHRHFPVEQQEQFAKEVSTAIGFDYSRGRLDVTAHPFCTELGPNDCRITTRFDPQFFNSAFFGTLHETGHGIYEQGLDPQQYGLPGGTYCSLGIHESQSRLWENLVGRSRSFWKHYFPTAQNHFPDALGDISEQTFYRAVNCISPSLIRVEADEATYNLHIAIRFELERDLIGGALAVDDLPGAWNDLYQKYLGITPATNSEGVLQDVHWSAGLIGYFPTYSLGNLYASQFFAAAQQALGNLDDMFAIGQFSELKNWLNQNVHQHGKRYAGSELGERIAGKPLGHVELVNHLKAKLKDVYGIQS